MESSKPPPKIPDLPSAFMASRFLTKTHSSAMTRSGSPCPAIHCRRAAVSTESGNSYFGSCAPRSRRMRAFTASTASSTRRPRAGSDSQATPGSRLVRKAVRTRAPFS